MREKVKFRTISVALILLPLSSPQSHAAGFALREYGFEAASTSFAGASAQDTSPSFLAYNPATSSAVDTWDMQVTLNAIYPTSDATFSLATTSANTPTGGAASPDDFIKDAYEPGLSLRLRLDDDWTAGVSVTAPWGLGTRYNKQWAGRYYAVESKLITVNVAPSVAWRVSPELTLSAGAQIEYAKGTLSNAIDFGTIGLPFIPGATPGAQDGFVEFNADDWAVGFVLGALWKPSADLTLGASYRSKLSHTLSGNVDFTLDPYGVGLALSTFSGAFIDTKGHTDLTLPAVASLGVSWSLNPQVTLLAEIGYTQWSELQELRVKFDNPLQPDNVQRYGWRDAWLGAIGVRYQPDTDWTLRAGLAIDETPTNDATRDPRIPDATRTWASFGIERKLSDSASLQIGYARLIFPPEPITLRATTPGNELRGNLTGRTDADADMISFQLTFR